MYMAIITVIIIFSCVISHFLIDLLKVLSSFLSNMDSASFCFLQSQYFYTHFGIKCEKYNLVFLGPRGANLNSVCRRLNLTQQMPIKI